MNISSTKTLKPRAPEKGSFPLNSEGLCQDFMKNYLECIKKHGYKGHECFLSSKNYVKCRMENGLMEREDLKKLGLE